MIRRMRIAPAPAFLSTERADLQGDWQVDQPILCVASRSPLDQAACAILAQLLDKHGLPTRVQSFTDVASARSFKIDAADAPLVCLSYFGSAGNPAHVRYLIKRLRRVMPNARFLAGFWMLLGNDAKAEEWRAAVGADLVATSLTHALEICVNEARAHFEHAKVRLGPNIGKEQMLVDGPAQQAKGKAQQKVGEAKSMIKDMADKGLTRPTRSSETFCRPICRPGTELGRKRLLASQLWRRLQ